MLENNLKTNLLETLVNWCEYPFDFILEISDFTFSSYGVLFIQKGEFISFQTKTQKCFIDWS